MIHDETLDIQTDMDNSPTKVERDGPPEELIRTVEAVLFAAHETMSPSALAPALNGSAAATLEKIVVEINRRLAEGDHPMRVRKVAGGYQMHALPEFAAAIEAALVKTKTQRLTRAGLETLAIIAYKQPCSTPEIEQIRGVSCGGVLSTLMERNLVTITGRSEGPGRPLQYGTTREFLNYFGLNSLNDLPSVEEIEELLAQRSPSNRMISGVMSVGEEDPQRLILKRPAESDGSAKRFWISDVRSFGMGASSTWDGVSGEYVDKNETTEHITITEIVEDAPVTTDASGDENSH